jgi:hypothetical protein
MLVTDVHELATLLGIDELQPADAVGTELDLGHSLDSVYPASSCVASAGGFAPLQAVVC